MFWPAFNHIGRAGTIFARHAHTNHQSGDEHGGVTGRKPACQGSHRKQNDAADHRQTTPIAIAHRAQ
ncbi:Uncharacterised protein [Salmonella enterica subsp. enterica serovar Bovismorbificans]|uniref:Uncharacterized protein n=1 Tax=Salmonella enterica subsp. enterica serovar Bovismorbificans TaxID=58097 RepID=A0A655CXQ5_SALET|nr:Uncharacterised protein [Salmonella enterica subsp. enterica serovar Bovismorbificans]